jgi:hypothetical protein
VYQLFSYLSTVFSVSSRGRRGRGARRVPVRVAVIPAAGLAPARRRAEAGLEFSNAGFVALRDDSDQSESYSVVTPDGELHVEERDGDVLDGTISGLVGTTGGLCRGPSAEGEASRR